VEYLIFFFITWVLYDYIKEKQRLKKLFNNKCINIYRLSSNNLYKYNNIKDLKKFEEEAYPKIIVHGKYLLFKGKKYIRQTEYMYKSDFNQEVILNLNSHFGVLEPSEEFSIITEEDFNSTINEEKSNAIVPQIINTSIENKMVTKFQIDYIYHMTHVNNLQNILNYGLLPHDNNAVNNKIDNPEVNSRRNFIEPIYNKNVHSYVPFYFNPKNPMLYVNKENQDNLIILVFDNTLIYEQGSLFTDGNASVNGTIFYNNINDLDNLNWKCLKSKYWNDFEDGKRLIMSEILVPNKVHINKLKKNILY
jgi:hypothetical protein